MLSFVWHTLCSSFDRVLWKSLVPPFPSLCFTRKMGNVHVRRNLCKHFKKINIWGKIWANICCDQMYVSRHPEHALISLSSLQEYFIRDESPALCFCQTVACGPRCRSAPLHHHHFFQRYYKNSQMYKPHECYIIRSLQHEFILCETGSDPCFIYIIIMGCTTASGQPHFNSSSLSPNKNQSYDPWCSAVLFPYCVSLYNDNSKNNNYSVPWNLFPDCWIVNTHMSQICLTF